MTGNPGGAAAPPDLSRDGAWRPVFRAVALVFVAIPLISILTTGADPVSVVLAIAGAAIFIAILTVNTQVPDESGFFGFPAPRQRIGDPRVLLVVTGVAVLALIAMAVAFSLRRPDAGWFAFFYFASTAASTVRNGRVAVGLMVIAGMAAGLTFQVLNGDVGSAIVQGLSVTIIGVTVYSAIAVRRTNRALVEARHELARMAVTEERARIARDLHDTLGHTLSVIALKSELAARLMEDDPARARSEMEDVQRVARESLSSVRETIGGYRRASLATELAGARSALAAAGIEGRVEPSPDGLPAAADAILGWAVREGVTNILRHARARTAEIRVEAEPASVSVEISNDRRADDGAEVDPPATAGAGSGLVGLRERVAAVGGEVEAGGLPDGGFRLRVSVPLA
jgi:two-component system, NarL family, sensor histidine kinase DesK